MCIEERLGSVVILGLRILRLAKPEIGIRKPSALGIGRDVGGKLRFGELVIASQYVIISNLVGIAFTAERRCFLRVLACTGRSRVDPRKRG
ncbi:hypothetical protein D3C87_1682060 [compost metagenome]